ncbi:MAG TPA: GNAT family N-acetyltransferase [Pirellulales bacterium]|nr:GNAT family N-acetyltransferase [Pirellulales bacterium]
MIEISPATQDDVDAYVAMAREAQAWIAARGLRQYVPAAHEAYAAAVAARVAAGTLYKVRQRDETIAFFALDACGPAWWDSFEGSALYVSGIVVTRSARGRGIGGEIIRFCEREAARRDCPFLRLDCHAGNAWLCAYYERQGFELQARIEQQKGYEGCLYQRSVLTS